MKGVLARQEISCLVEAVSGPVFTENRDALLAGVDRSVVGGIPNGTAPTAQTVNDLTTLNSLEPKSAAILALSIWLRNAILLSGGTIGRRVFDEALDVLRGAERDSFVDRQRIYDLYDRAEARHLERLRLLNGVPAGVIAALPIAAEPSRQILADLTALNVLSSGDALTTWLTNARNAAPELDWHLDAMEGRVASRSTAQPEISGPIYPTAALMSPRSKKAATAENFAIATILSVASAVTGALGRDASTKYKLQGQDGSTYFVEKLAVQGQFMLLTLRRKRAGRAEIPLTLPSCHVRVFGAEGWLAATAHITARQNGFIRYVAPEANGVAGFQGAPLIENGKLIGVTLGYSTEEREFIASVPTDWEASS